MSDKGIYWETRVVSWQATTDKDGNVVKTGPEQVRDVLDNGTENLPNLSDTWQVEN